MRRTETKAKKERIIHFNCISVEVLGENRLKITGLNEKHEAPSVTV